MDKAIILIILSQLVSAIAIIFTIKADINWLKKMQEKHDSRITEIERNSYHRRASDT